MSKRATEDGSTSSGTGAIDPVPEAARSPTSILPAKPLVCPRINRDLPRRIFVPDDRAKLGMHEDPLSPSSRENTPRKTTATRSRDLPRRVLLSDDTSTTTTPTSATPRSRKRAAPVQAPVTPARRRKQNLDEGGAAAVERVWRRTSVAVVEEATTSVAAVEAEGITVVEAALAEATTALPRALDFEEASATPVLAAAASPEYFRGRRLEVEEQQVEGRQGEEAVTVPGCSPSSPRTPPRSPVAAIPETPKAPIKRERTTVDRLPRAATHSIRRLNFGL